MLETTKMSGAKKNFLDAGGAQYIQITVKNCRGSLNNGTDASSLDKEVAISKDMPVHCNSAPV